tara:strand:+ start:471 stop:1301 length:831 start_codon:yes stop_codon:yes gene_type:complete
MPKKYAAIIGLNPSKGARSPKLWNKAFSMLNLETKMICIDINSKDEVENVIKNLEEDSCFIGGCIAFPYKETIFKILNVEMIDKISQPIGAVNCLYRKNDNFLRATNTDGYAALTSFLNLVKNKGQMPKSILIGGLGGAGKAVASFFSDYFVPKGTRVICSSRKNNSIFCESINSEWIPWQDIEKELYRFDTFVNCTTFGTGQLINKSPINVFSDLEYIYDIVYDPYQTKLLYLAEKNKISHTNGLEMNLLQAAKAFKFAGDFNIDDSKIVEMMSI